jgi:hypothetical protein
MHGLQLSGRISLLAALLLPLVGLLPLPNAPTAQAAEYVALPYVGGEAVRIGQGYEGGTHQGRSRYGLDLFLANGKTSGAEAVAPIDGSISYAPAPGTGNGCLAITARGGDYSVMLCHLILARAFKNGEAVSRGQTLGMVGAAGEVGNNGAPHIHLELHRGGGISNPVPFSPPDGLPLEGVALASGSQLTGLPPIVSSNRPGGQPLARTGASQPEPSRGGRAAQDAAAKPETPAQGAGSDARSGANGGGGASGALGLALVAGTGSCLKVREQPSAEAASIDCLPDGTEVKLRPLADRSGDDGWRQVESRGWVATEYLKRSRALVAGTDGCLNVREKPSSEAKIRGCLAEGSAVVVAEGPVKADSLQWYRIEGSRAVEKGGWVAGQYLD